MAILSGGDELLILVSRMPYKQLKIGPLGGLKVEALGSGVMETGKQVAVCRVNPRGNESERHVSMSLLAVQRIAEQGEKVSEEGYRFKEALLVKGPAMGICLEHEPMLRVGALI